MNLQSAPLFLIDAYGLIYRSYFAFLSRPLRDAEGRNVSALFGFMRSLINLLDEGAVVVGPEKPRFLAAVFDSRQPTFRHKLFAEYKATRQKTPEDLHAQVPMVEEVLAALGVPLLRVDGYEADDIIATLAERCRAEKRGCYIVSADKDLLQLVGDGVFQLRPGKGRGPYDLIGTDKIVEEWGVPSGRILDLLSLTGDASDNVPGVMGIGDKTAAKLLAHYGDLDAIYENLANIEGSVGHKLAAGRENAYFSRKLIQLETQVSLSLEKLDDLSVAALDRVAGARVLLRYGAKSLAVILAPEIANQKAADDAKAVAVKDSSTPNASPTNSPQGELFDTEAELLVKGRYSVIDTLADLEKLLARAKAQNRLTLDFETDSLDAWTANPIGLALAVEIGEAFYVPLAPHALSATDPTLAAPYLDPAEVRRRLATLTSDPAMTITAHNAKYDYEVSRAWGLERWRCRIWDTMVAAWLADDRDRPSYALDALVADKLHLPVTPYDSIVPKGQNFAAVPLATAAAYAGEDADYALRIKTLLEPILDHDGSMALFRDLEMPLLPILAEMEGAGILIDGNTLHQYGLELAGELKSIERHIYDLVGHEFNIASTKQLQEVLFVERKFKTGKKTQTGFSTDVAVLEELARNTDDPVPGEILHYRQLAKLKSTYVDTLPKLADATGRIHTHFGQTGTATGRLSSRDPNLQNIPVRDAEGRRIRAAFRASPGQILVSADYNQIELVVLAHLSQDPALCAAFQSGQDVHRRTAALIFGIDENAVSPEQRRMAKTINFGVMYGMSAFRLSNELRISRSEAQNFIDAYFRTYAGVHDYIKQLIARTEITGYSETILHRRRQIPTIKSANKTEKSAAERMAVNTPIQGSAADIVKLAMLRIDAALPTIPSARLLLQVHDELIFECAEADAENLAIMAIREMESAFVLKVPLRATVEIGATWGELH